MYCLIEPFTTSWVINHWSLLWHMYCEYSVGFSSSIIDLIYFPLDLHFGHSTVIGWIVVEKNNLPVKYIEGSMIEGDGIEGDGIETQEEKNSKQSKVKNIVDLM